MAIGLVGFHGYSHLTGGFDGGQAEYARVPFGKNAIAHVLIGLLIGLKSVNTFLPTVNKVTLLLTTPKIQQSSSFFVSRLHYRRINSILYFCLSFALPLQCLKAAIVWSLFTT